MIKNYNIKTVPLRLASSITDRYRKKPCSSISLYRRHVITLCSTRSKSIRLMSLNNGVIKTTHSSPWNKMGKNWEENTIWRISSSNWCHRRYSERNGQELLIWPVEIEVQEQAITLNKTSITKHSCCSSKTTTCSMNRKTKPHSLVLIRTSSSRMVEQGQILGIISDCVAKKLLPSLENLSSAFSQKRSQTHTKLVKKLSTKDYFQLKTCQRGRQVSHRVWKLSMLRHQTITTWSQPVAYTIRPYSQMSLQITKTKRTFCTKTRVAPQE